MTNPHPATPDAGLACEMAAADAARAAGVTIRELADLEELDSVCRLYDGIWRPDPANPPVTTELLRVLGKTGNYVAGAFEEGRLAGACAGFFGPPADSSLYSHIAGVAPGVRGRGVGWALKLHQRAWTLLRGGRTIYWAFDPLVSRNAHFNLSKLAAVPVEYLPNYYGSMGDGINRDDDSDRLLVRWQLDTPEVVAACAGKPAAVDGAAARAHGAIAALSSSDAGLPVSGSLDAPTLLVGVPRDIEVLRASDPESAKRWRAAVREVLGGLMANGARITGFDPDGWYVVASCQAQNPRPFWS